MRRIECGNRCSFPATFNVGERRESRLYTGCTHYASGLELRRLGEDTAGDGACRDCSAMRSALFTAQLGTWALTWLSDPPWRALQVLAVFTQLQYACASIFRHARLLGNMATQLTNGWRLAGPCFRNYGRVQQGEPMLLAFVSSPILRVIS